MLLLLPLFAAGEEICADSVMDRFFTATFDGDKIGEYFGDLYVKQRVEVLRNNLALNTFPDMTRFDKGVDNYVSELFYEVYYTDYGVLEMRRKSYNTNFRHGKGEMKRVLEFMKFNPSDKIMLQGRIYSPLSPENRKYYVYSVDTLDALSGMLRISFEHKFDNVRLLTGGWLLVDGGFRLH